MSTWTSEHRHGGREGRPSGARPRAAVLVLAVLALAGCGEEMRLASLGSALSGNAPAAAPALRVARGAVAIAGPAGYCVDPVSTRDGRNGAFVLLGSCAAMTGTGRPPTRQAVLTAAVSPPGDGPPVAESAELLASFFGSTVGRGMIARSGRPEDVTLLSAHAHDGVLYLRLRDESPFEGAAVAPDYWRAVLDAGRHVISLSAIPLAARPLRADATLALLEEFLARIRTENAAPPPQAGMLRAPPSRPSPS